MNVDISALRAVEKEKGIELGSLIDTLETALLTAYRHTQGHAGHARVEIDRKTGEIRVWAQETADHQRVRARRSSGSGTTPRRTSAGSPPPPPGRSSCSGCATSTTSAPSATSPAASTT